MTDHIAPMEPEGVTRTISVVGLQVSQAADELGQAAQRLIDAETRTREAETRWQNAEEQIAEGATKNAELLEMLRVAREAHAEAEDRTRRAEQRLQTSVERIEQLEEQVRDLESGIVDAAPSPVTVVLDDDRAMLQDSIAGEVRRPLASIMGLTLALKHGDLRSSEGAEMVRQLATNARKLDRLVVEMLDLEKIATGEFEPTVRRTDLEALVRRVVDESTDLQNREVIVDTEHVAVELDPALTEQMVEMLLANAGRRTTPGNPVWIKLTERTDGATIAVEDTGAEIPVGLRGSLFTGSTDEGPAARRKPRGATGLSLLARFAALQNGRAWVEPRPGGGASFRIWLPMPVPPSGDDGGRDRDGDVMPLHPMETIPDTPCAPSASPDLSEERALELARALLAAGNDEMAAIFGSIGSTGDPLSDRLISGGGPDRR